ncbi:MAG: hypothetical protein HY336_01990 [Candidatus Doudnabacteria bacterium]|nr:hypothetical protein [Candidatus Doudnabacteria bacterium]
MARLILFSILFTIVYSWPETKHAIKIILYRLFAKKSPYYSRNNDDVGLVLMFMTLPISLVLFLSTTQDLNHKLILISLQLLLTATVSFGVAEFLKRLRYLKHAQHSEKILFAAYAVLGFLTPAFKVAVGSDKESRALAKIAFTLSIPALLAVGLKFLTDKTSSETLIPNLDILITVMFGSAVVLVTINFLEAYLRIYRFRQSASYFRLLLGLILILILFR